MLLWLVLHFHAAGRGSEPPDFVRHIDNVHLFLVGAGERFGEGTRSGRDKQARNERGS